jgi:UDP-N-acetylmuramoyl-tripeptide--D-alanyl-D-alanine ligase
MLATILSQKGRVLTSDHVNTVWGNANLLGQYIDEKYIVLECGMDKAGEIAWHVNSEDPDLGILLNIGYVHAQKLGSIENIYEEKKNLADYLNRMGRPLVLNIDDERLARIPSEYHAKLITFGRDESADFRIENINVDELGTDFDLVVNTKLYKVHINTFGEGLVYDAVGAIAAANTLGLTIDECVEGIKNFYPNSGRFEKIELGDGNIIINDAYNANPDSMEMSLNTFDKLYPKDKYFRVAFLGDMKELGDVSASEHKKLGELVEGLNFDKVYYLGTYFKDFNYGEELHSVEDAVGILRNILKDKKNVVVLLKASHSIGFLEIPDLL